MDSLTRGIPAAALEAMSGPYFFPAALVRIDWPGGVVRAHSGVGTIAWDGADWPGVGVLGGLDVPPEETGLARSLMTLTLIGAWGDLGAVLADAPDLRGRRVDLYQAVVTRASGAELIGAPWPVFTGTVDRLRDLLRAIEGGVSRGVELVVSSGPSQQSRRALYHTDEGHQALHPGDTLFRHLKGVAARRAALTR